VTGAKSLFLSRLFLGSRYKLPVVTSHSSHPFLEILGKARQGRGELPRAASGRREVVADGKRDRTVYNIAMIRQGCMRSMNHHHRHHHLALAGRAFYSLAIKRVWNALGSSFGCLHCKLAAARLRCLDSPPTFLLSLPIGIESAKTHSVFQFSSSHALPSLVHSRSSRTATIHFFRALFKSVASTRSKTPSASAVVAIPAGSTSLQSSLGPGVSRAARSP